MKLAEYLDLAQKDYPSVDVKDIEIILAAVLKIPKLDLWLEEERKLAKAELAKIDMMLFQRAEDEPLQYILGETVFRNLNIEVGEGVLIPRPETELLVDIALDLIANIENPDVCDLGTGSGAIALAIASENPHANVTGTDISKEALNYAAKNKLKNKVGNVEFIFGDLFLPFQGINGSRQFHLITANLPYVSELLFETLPKEVRDFEPESALLAEDGGLSLIKKAAEDALRHLHPEGHIIFEFSPEQEDDISGYLNQLNYSEVSIKKDLNGRARFAVAQYSGK